MGKEYYLNCIETKWSKFSEQKREDRLSENEAETAATEYLEATTLIGSNWQQY